MSEIHSSSPGTVSQGRKSNPSPMNPSCLAPGTRSDPGAGKGQGRTSDFTSEIHSSSPGTGIILQVKLRIVCFIQSVL